MLLGALTPSAGCSAGCCFLHCYLLLCWLLLLLAVAAGCCFLQCWLLAAALLLLLLTLLPPVLQDFYSRPVDGAPEGRENQRGHKSRRTH